MTEDIKKEVPPMKVELTSKDIIHIVEIMCLRGKGVKYLGPAHLQFLFYDAIRHCKGVDFFKEEILDESQRLC